MKQLLVIKKQIKATGSVIGQLVQLSFLYGLFSFSQMTVNAQTVVSNETFPNQYNTSFGSTNNTNGTFTGSAGTWTASCNSSSLAAIAVIQAYYTPRSSYAIKIVNWNTAGKGASECFAASPTVNLSNYGCSPNLNLSFNLYTYTCSPNDPNSYFKVEFSADGGSTWNSAWSMSSAQLYNTYGANGYTNISVPVTASHRVSNFKYRFSGYKPSNQGNNFYLFVDDAKITATSCITCNGRITSLYFNELNNGPDLPITNGSAFTVAQLGSAYNLEAGTSGTIGSVKYTITGPTPSSNIENVTPYNSPGTGSGAWTGAVGTYSVNLKTYSSSNATGTLCHDTTITFNLTSASCAPTVTVLKPLAGVTCTNTFEYRICKPAGCSATSHWSIGLPSCFTAGNISAVYVNNNLYSSWVITTDNNCNNFFGLKVDNISIPGGSCMDIKIVFASNYTVGSNNWADKASGDCYYGGPVAAPSNCTSCTTNGSIGDRVWLDADGDGIQDATETGGITGVTVQLRNSANTVIATQTTNSTGNYLFTGLAAGTYTVAFPVSISGAVVTTANVGTNDDIDSDPSQTTGITPSITLAAGQNITNVDAGYRPTTLQLGNRVFNDVNNNGIDNTEAGISGATVNLYKDDNNDNVADGAAIATTTTNTTGNYTFSNLAPGNYIVGVVTPAGYTSSAINGGDPDNNTDLDDNGQVIVGNETRGLAITLEAGAEPNGYTNNTYDFGFYASSNSLTLGNKVFYDLNRSGFYDAGDGFVAGATVKLYADANNDNVADGAFIQAQQTNAFGEYSFTNLAAGNYIVGVAIPATYAITVVNGGDPDNNIDNDNNAIITIAGEARGNSITLALGTEPGGNTNNTYDIGFYNPLAPPNGGENCFSGTNPIVYAKSYWNVNVNAQTVTMRVTFSKKFVDNCYKASGAPDNWTRGHSFSDLLGSDHLQWSIRDANGVEKLKFKQDYISASNTFPSGYGCLGFGGDGSNPTVGLTTDVLSFRTSLATNFNDYGYVLTNDSPPTDSNYTPNPAQPNWIYDVWYEVTVKASVFGTTGFGFVNVASVHASPSKTGNNTEVITNNPCAAGSIGDRVWNDINKNGVQDANEVGLAGIVVTLYDGTTNKVLASTVTDGYGNYQFSGLETSATGINYQVRFSAAAGYRLSPNNGLVTDNNNSDANITTGRTGTITLTNAVPNVTYVDAGMYYTETARVGDFVWNDLNKNGIQEAGEPGIAGVNVMLYTSANLLFRSTVTANNGLYYFNDVPAGTYYIKVSPPIGYQVSPKDAAADNLDSDIDPVTRQTSNFTVVAGTSNLTLDAGLNVTSTTGASASLGDKVWEDLNNNNIQDAGEPGIANVTVQLYNSANVLQATVTTDAFGNYIFNGLNAGSYYVRFTLPAGFGYVTANVGSNDAVDSDADATGTTQTVVLVADEINTTVDAGMRRTTGGAALGDFVWYDLNKNGLQDGGSEVGVPGITVLLYNSSNTVVGTTTTDMNGYYLFTGLPAATTYTVGFENIPAGYGFSANNGAVTVTNNSDVNPSTGRTGNVTTGAAGTTISYVDAGLISTPKVFDSKSTVGDRVWNDLNNNGIQDAGEPGIAGVTVTLYAANGTTVIATTITDALGNYLFTNLDAGTYVIGFSGLPAGYVFATKDAGTNDEKDSDADGVSGKTAPFSLAAGEINLSLDAGARNTSTTVSSLGNFVWYDLNNNGLQDSGEPGAAGISVELTNMAGLVIGTTTTSATGEYRFTDLPANNYYIEFTNLPAGYTIGQKNIGADDAVDSDPTVSTGKTDVIGLPVSTNDLTWDMGIVTTTRASIGDFVWNDTNGNGIQDAGEPGVAGITVTLYDNNNNPVASTVTDANGFYLFSNILPGTYSVGFSNIPASSTFTTQNAPGSNAANNSDADPATGRTASFTLVGGQSKTDVDAGLISLKAAVGDYVWHDLNRNGIQDATENGVPGVTVTLYRSTDATIGNGDDVAIASAVTDANGYYFINDVPVPAGGFTQYYMRYTDVQSSYSSFTTPLVGGTTAANNSKVTSMALSGGRSGFFTLNPGQVYRDMDAGVYKQINLSGNVWHDVNGMDDNLVNNSGAVQVPPAIPIPTGLRVTLVDAVTGNTVRVALVQGNGMYSFNDVAPGNYILVLGTVPGVPGQPSPFATLPSGWTNTGENLGLQPGRDPVVNGKLTVSLTTTSVTNANFGMQLVNDDIGIN